MCLYWVTTEDHGEDWFVVANNAQERTSFPWISAITMLFPIAAMATIANQGAPILPTLGYGFANLGYLLFGAGIVAGSFRALGFRYRISTIIAGVTIWIVGTVWSKYMKGY